MTRTLYQLGIIGYATLIRIAALFNRKAQLWVSGRKNWASKLKQAKTQIKDPCLWIHCASLGEFEQGRPIIEAVKKELPEYSVVLSFFSPSGYEIRKSYPLADYVCYMPKDTQKNAEQFLQILDPQIALFIKYEFWYHFLTQLQQRGTTTLLVSAIFRPDQIFFKKQGGFFREILKTFTHIFVQNESSAKLLRNIGIKEISVGGDTRIDRVLGIAQESKALPAIEAFCGNAKVLVAGSTWPADEQYLLPFFNQLDREDWKLIIAPHEIHDAHIQQIEAAIKLPSIRYSQKEHLDKSQHKVMIIDNIGLLSAIYKYGTLAYIGGGFGKGIHNTLEPGAFGLPIIFGPKYQKFEEANHLVASGGAFSINNMQELKRIFEQINDGNGYEGISQKVHNYISQNQGATNKVMAFIKNNI